MEKWHQFEVIKNDLEKAQLAGRQAPEIAQGEISVKIERFAFTANNISYGVVGERIGYWKFFPTFNPDAKTDADNKWGVIPVWGIGVVEESRCAGIEEGERLYGYFPMGSHLVLKPEKIKQERFLDGSEHRASLPPVYNNYNRLNTEENYTADTDDERILLMPLYATSFCLYDFLIDNKWFGASKDANGQVIIPSASSKTALGLAYALCDDKNAPHLVGFTSSTNRQMVKACGLYDQVLSYDQLSGIDASRPSVIIDMSGNGQVLSDLHGALGEQMRYCANVGLTHYDSNKMGPDFISERSAMFFAPSHIQKRAAEWGPGVFEAKAGEFWFKTSMRTREWQKIIHSKGVGEIENVYREALRGDVPAAEARIVVL